MLAYSRPFLPLFLHVLGAMTLYGVVIAAIAVAFTRRAAATYTSLLAAIPAWVVTAVGAYWIEAKEDLPNDPAWIGIGHDVLELGLLVLLAALFSARWWARSGKQVAGRIAAALSVVYLVLLTVAMLAMAGKWG